MGQVRRRKFLIDAAILLAAPVAFAEQARRPYRIGLLYNNKGPYLEAFVRGLADLGYVEGRNIVIERRSADGRSERLQGLAAELVGLDVNVLVTPDPPSTYAAKAATKTIPIVMRSSNDPVETGLVTSLARPGGNITGVYSLYAELTPKRLELLKETIPALTRVAVLWDSSSRGSASEWKKTQTAARGLRLALYSLDVHRHEEFDGAFRAASAAHAGALITLRNPHIVAQRAQVVALAAKNRMPAMYDEREFIDVGGLMAYGASLDDLYRRTAVYTDKILKGAKPADLPIEQPTKFDLVINLGTARALGLTIPQSVLLQATKVIE